MKANSSGLRVLLLSTFVSNIGSYLVIPVMGISLVTEKHLSVSEVATIFAAMAFGKTAGSLLAGPFADRTDARFVLIIGLVCRVVAFAMLVLCNQPLELATASVLIRLGSGLYIPTAKAIITALSPPDRIGVLLARRSMFANLGIVLGPPLGIVISSTIGNDYLYWTGAGVFLGLTVLHVNIGSQRTSTSKATREYLGNVFVMFRHEQFVMLMLFSVGFNVFHALLFLVMPIYGRVHITESAPQIAYTINALIVVASQLTVSKRIFSARNDVISFAGFGLIALACYLFGAGPDKLAFFVVGVALYSLAEVVLLLRADYLASALGRKTLGAIFSAASLLEAIGSMVGNKLFGGMFNSLPYITAWYAAGMLAAVTAIGTAYVSIRTKSLLI